MNDTVVRYLDIQMPLDKLASMFESGFTLSKASDNIQAFQDALLSKPQEPKDDVNVQEATIMEGFRYRIDDTKFPVFNGNQSLKGSYPIIPIGMLDIWRQEDKGGVDIDDFFWN